MGYQRLALKRVHLDAAPQAQAGITGSFVNSGLTLKNSIRQRQYLTMPSNDGKQKLFHFSLTTKSHPAETAGKVAIGRVSPPLGERGAPPQRKRLACAFAAVAEGRSPSRSRFQLNRRALGAYSAATAPSRFLERNERWGDSHLLSSCRPSILRTTFDNTSRRN